MARVSPSGEGNMGAGRKRIPCPICGARHSKPALSRAGGAVTTTCFRNRSFFGFLAAGVGVARGFGRFRRQPLRVQCQPLPLLFVVIAVISRNAFHAKHADIRGQFGKDFV